MLTPDEIVIKLNHPALNLSYLSRDIGISYMTLWKLSRNNLKRVPYELIKTLSDYFNAS